MCCTRVAAQVVQSDGHEAGCLTAVQADWRTFWEGWTAELCWQGQRTFDTMHQS